MIPRLRELMPPVFQVGKTLWEDVPRDMRKELWLSILARNGRGTALGSLYMKLQTVVRHQPRCCIIQHPHATTIHPHHLHRVISQHYDDVHGSELMWFWLWWCLW